MCKDYKKNDLKNKNGMVDEKEDNIIGIFMVGGMCTGMIIGALFFNDVSNGLVLGLSIGLLLGGICKIKKNW